MPFKWIIQSLKFHTIDQDAASLHWLISAKSVQQCFLNSHKTYLLPPDRGDGQGEEEVVDLRGVDWADVGPLAGCGVGGAPNRSPSRSVVVPVVGGCGEDGGSLAASPSSPSRSTSSAAGEGAAAGWGSGFLSAFDFSLLVLLCWLERESISSSEGSLSSFGPTLPPQLPWPWAGSKGQAREMVRCKEQNQVCPYDFALSPGHTKPTISRRATSGRFWA